MSNSTDRNNTVDLLRVIGLFLVISAHCEFPQWYFEFREFDVVLLFFVSGMSFLLSSKGKDIKYADYVWKRIRKLIIPVWVFLTLFFPFFFLLGRHFSASVILKSYLLVSGGILFIWVYRVFFSSALINPLLQPFARDKIVKYMGFIIIGVLLANDFLLKEIRLLAGNPISKGFEYLVTYTVSYAVLSFSGMVWARSDKRSRVVFTVLFFAVFLISGFLYRFPSFYEWKYPPTLYYCSYGLFMSGFLYLALDHFHISGRFEQVIEWISRKTMTIYLWHIFIYYLLETSAPHVLKSGFSSLIVMFGGGLLAACIQEKAMAKKRTAHV